MQNQIFFAIGRKLHLSYIINLKLPIFCKVSFIRMVPIAQPTDQLIIYTPFFSSHYFELFYLSFCGNCKKTIRRSKLMFTWIFNTCFSSTKTKILTNMLQLQGIFVLQKILSYQQSWIFLSDITCLMAETKFLKAFFLWNHDCTFRIMF